MFTLAVFNILHNRINLPKEEYQEKDVDDVKYVVYKQVTRNRIIKEFHKWMKGAKDAFRKDYVSFCICVC